MRELERAYAFAAALEASPLAATTVSLEDHAIRLARPMTVTPDFVTANKVEGEQTGGKGTAPSSPRSGRIHTMGIQRRLRGIGGAYSALALPVEHVLMKAILGGHNVVTTGGSEKVEYFGVDEDEGTLKTLAQTMKKEYVTQGVVPRSARITSTAGGHIQLECELIGVGTAPTQQALEAATLDSVVPPLFKGATFTIDGVALRPRSFTHDFGITLTDALLDGTAGDAHAGYAIADREEKGSMQIHMTDLADFDPIDLAATSSNVSFVAQFGTTPYNRILCQATMEIMKASPAAQGGVGMWDIEYEIRRPAGATGSIWSWN